MLCVGRSWRRLGWRLRVAGLLGFILGFFLRGTMWRLCVFVGEWGVRLNEEHSEYGFFDVLPGGLHPYLLEVVRGSGWGPGGGVGV